MLDGDLDKVARLLTASAAGLLGVERVGVWLFNEPGTELLCIDQFNLSSGEHTSGAVLREHEFRDEFSYLKGSLYVAAADPLTDPRTRGYVERYLKPNRITSMLDIVVRFGGRDLGTLCFEHVERPHAWTRSEIDFGCLVASQLSILLERRAFREADANRRRTEELLTAARELDVLKSRFFSNISHEFRTPLTLLLSPVETLLEGAKDAPTEWQRDQLNMIRRGALRMLKLVVALMDFARIDACRSQAVFRPTDIGHMTRDLAAQFEPAVALARLRFRIECESLNEPAYLDRDSWEKIVLNLLSNALKFTYAGEIAVMTRMTDLHHELRVCDTGVGIQTEHLPRLFDRFYRVPDAKGRSFEGAGIGLALVKELVQLHGGSIHVESRLDHGTQFTIRIPRGSTHLPEDQVRHDIRARTPGSHSPLVEETIGWVTEEKRARPPSSLETTRPRILVVEDNPDLLRHITEILGDAYAVECARDGLEALAAMGRAIPSLVVTDLMMPNLDGLGLIREIRRRPDLAPIPILVITAREADVSGEAAGRAGADDYLFKPFSASVLKSRIRVLLSLHRSRVLLQSALGTNETDLEALAMQISEKLRV